MDGVLKCSCEACSHFSEAFGLLQTWALAEETQCSLVRDFRVQLKSWWLNQLREAFWKSTL